MLAANVILTLLQFGFGYSVISALYSMLVEGKDTSEEVNVSRADNSKKSS